LTSLNNFQDILLVSIGAVFGANSRFIIYQKLKEININENFIILLINISSSFLLGLFISVFSKLVFFNFSSQIVLFFLIGFLGSLSTFSTFVYDLFDSFIKLKFFRALKLFALSFSLGIIAVALGALVGN
tara:strand:+ start:364 stop:753 length:390 start_codon:yes stop_codon:yes gene_type:complete